MIGRLWLYFHGYCQHGKRRHCRSCIDTWQAKMHRQDAKAELIAKGSS